jgi:diadenosine tetraphosphate (Ap4A) HIT family hydrolase
MRHELGTDCLACDLTNGARGLPAGRVYETNLWVVEPCIGPLPVGTLIVKPFRHCLSVAALKPDEAEQLGPLLALMTRTITELTECDQVYIGLWSHAGWTPGHIHFVLQPAWNGQKTVHELPGPFMQETMFRASETPAESEVEAFCERARELLSSASGRRKAVG